MAQARRVLYKESNTSSFSMANLIIIPVSTIGMAVYWHLKKIRSVGWKDCVRNWISLKQKVLTISA